MKVWIDRFSEKYIEQVLRIEEKCFSDPWSRGLFESELNNARANYSVLLEDETVIGYAGFWKIDDEAHIMNFAVGPEYQGRHMADILMKDLIERAGALLIRSMTLEVRIGNKAARGLYEKYGFKSAGVRKKYYTDNGEDAVIMWAEI